MLGRRSVSLSRRTGAPHSWSSWVPILAPALPFLAALPAFGRLQRNDYFFVIGNFAEWSFPIIKSNEHTIPLPALAYWANVLLTQGDNRGLSAFALGLLLIEVICIVRMLPDSIGSCPWLRMPLGAAICAVVFTPAVAHSMVMGFSGSIWFLSNAFAVGAICALCTARPSWRMPLAIGLGWLGLFSYSTNLSLWPALLLGALAIGCSRREWAGLLLAAGLAYGVYLFGFKGVSRSPVVNATDFWLVCRYWGVYLGGLLAGSPGVAMLTGQAALVGAILLCGTLLPGADASQRRALAPWLMLMIYGAANGLGTAFGRSRLGLDQALASRYCSLSALFWIGLCGLVLYALLGPRPGRLLRDRRRTWLAIGLIAGGVATVYVRGLPVLEAQLQRVRRLPVAELALYYGVDDSAALRLASPAPQEISAARPLLKSMRHVPFDRRRVPEIGDVLGQAQVASTASAAIQWRLLRHRPIAGWGKRIVGRVSGDGHGVDRIVFLTEDWRVVGDAVFVNAPLEEESGERGTSAPTGLSRLFTGYVRALRGQPEPQPFVRMQGESVFRRLTATAIGTAPATRPDSPAERR